MLNKLQAKNQLCDFFPPLDLKLCMQDKQEVKGKFQDGISKGYYHPQRV